MSEPVFQSAQMDSRYLSHVAPINHMVDELRTGGDWLPYVAPTYGGVNARMLAILRDPGPKTRDEGGSGMLSVDNDDPTAQRYLSFLTSAGIPLGELLAWNAYPWYINDKPTAGQLTRALPVLHRLIAMCPQLQVVMVHGGDAHKAWRMFSQSYPQTTQGLHVIETYHTSRQALQHPDPLVRQGRDDKLRADFAQAAALLQLDRQPRVAEPVAIPQPSHYRTQPPGTGQEQTQSPTAATLPVPVDALHAEARRRLQQGQTVEQIGRATNRQVWYAAFVEEARLNGELIAEVPAPADAVQLRDEQKLRWHAVAARLFGDARKTAQAQSLYDQAAGPGAAKRSWTGRGRVFPDMET
jgi:hypothetical protein